MKKPVFVNVNEKALKETLQRIGKPMIREALKGRDMETPKELKRFQLEWNGKRAALGYAYSSDRNEYQYSHIMMVPNGDLPEYGWTIRWHRY